MFAVVQSLDVSLELESAKGSFEDMRKRYELFGELDDVFLLTSDTSSFQSKLGTKIHHVPCNSSQNRVLEKAISRSTLFRWGHFFLRSLCWLIKNHKSVELIIGENVDSPAPLFASIIFGIPYVIYYHYDLANQLMKINKRYLLGILIMCEERFAFNRADRVWVTSSHLVPKVRVSRERNEITVVPNWIDEIEIRREHFKSHVPNSSQGPKILFVGRLHLVKRVDLLIDAFSCVQRDFPAANLNLLGDGETKATLAEKINNLGLQDNIHLLGFVERSKVFSMMKESDLLVLCSETEGNPRVILEAMFSGLPIVATRSFGITDLVHHLRTGFLVAHNPSAQELADAIKYVYENKCLSAALADEAYSYAKSSFSRTQIRNIILKEVLDILKSNPIVRKDFRS